MNFTCNASSNFIFNRNDKPVEYKVFNTIDDILPILRQCEKNKDDDKEFNLIHSENNLMQIFCDLKRVGYTPFITWKAGQIENLKMRFNSVVFNVRNQSLVSDAVDSSIIVNNTDVFNKVNNAMFEFNKSLFSPSHKSFYDKQDMEILRDYRTIVPHGAFWRYDKEKPFNNQLVEIDVNKAFTSAFVSIDRVPVFSEFDAWKRYDKHGVEKMNDLTLYFVSCRFYNLMLNKQFGLVYGMFLKKNVDDVEIIAYKVPSHIYKVDYKKIVKKLWETDISSDEKLDKAVKKMIANINFGLLEKGHNIKSKSMTFNKMEDAVYYREKYGGKINVLIDEEKTWDEETESYVGKVVASYYVLTVSDEKRLTNGFRFLKELLLQHHNFKMNSVYKMFRENSIDLYSVKTDAFVIKKK